jgi:hypothetical protein
VEADGDGAKARHRPSDAISTLGASHRPKREEREDSISETGQEDTRRRTGTDKEGQDSTQRFGLSQER